MFKFCMLFLILSLDIVLLIINSFFCVSSEPEIQLGIKAVNYYGKVLTFDEFSKICEESDVPKVICGQIPDIKSAGSLLLAFICFDVLIVNSYLVLYCIQYYTVSKLISKKLREEPSDREKHIIKCSYYCKFALVSHPVILNLACGLWIELSQIEVFSNKITLKAGVIILIIQCFLSLLVIAMLLWDASSARRKSARLKKTCESMKKTPTLKSLAVKSDSIDSTFEKPLDFSDLGK